MLLYKKEAARDLIFPNNKKIVTDLYKSALDDIAKEYYRFNPFKSHIHIVPFLRGYWNYSYGNIPGLHMVSNANILELRISTIISHGRGYIGPSYYPHILHENIDNLYHKIRRFRTETRSLVQNLQLLSFNSHLADYVVIGRMVVKLGSMKRPRPTL